MLTTVTRQCLSGNGQLNFAQIDGSKYTGQFACDKHHGEGVEACYFPEAFGPECGLHCTGVARWKPLSGKLLPRNEAWSISQDTPTFIGFFREGDAWRVGT